MANEQDKRVDVEKLETAEPAAPSDAADDTVFPADSPSSESDDGLDDANLEDNETADLDEDLEDDLNGLDSDFRESDTPGEIQEIPMTDLDDGVDELAPPEMSDLNTPGEIDIEDLDDDALDNTNLPPDARLDPIEE